MNFVVVAGGDATASVLKPRRCGRVAASLCAGLVCGAATFGAVLAVQTTDLGTSTSGLGNATDFWQPWWWLVVGASVLALGFVAALGCALRKRMSWSKRRLAHEIGSCATVQDLYRLPAPRSRPKIYPETTPRQQTEYDVEPCESPVDLRMEDSPAAARILLTSLARLLLFLSFAYLGGGIVLLGWMYGWVWIRACETEVRWLVPTFDCRFGVSEVSESDSYSRSAGVDASYEDMPLPSAWIASSLDTLSLAFLQMVGAVTSVFCNAIWPACMVDCLALTWVVAKACIFVAAIAEENAVGLVLAALDPDDESVSPSSSMSNAETAAAVWAPQRAAFLCIGLTATSAHLVLLLKMRHITHLLWSWRQRVRRYRATQGWSSARAGWNINGDLEFVAGDILLIDHEDAMYEEPDAREFDLLPFQYAEIENRPRLCRCCLREYRTKGGAVPMRLMEMLLPDGEVKADRNVERLTAEVLAAATEKTVDIMVEQSTYRATQTVKTHPAARPHSARPHSAHSSVAGSSDYETDRSDATAPISAPSQRLAVRRALSSVMRQAERDEVSRATVHTAVESDALRCPNPEAIVTSDTQDRRAMAAALALEAKARPFGPGGDLPGLAQHSIAVSASEIATGVVQSFARVMDTSQTLANRFGPSLDDPLARPRSASARISSAGVVAVSMQGLRQELRYKQDGGTNNMAQAGTVRRLRSVRHRPSSAKLGGGSRPGSSHSSRSGSGTRRPLSAQESVKALQVFDKLIADSDPPALPGWTHHQDNCGDTYYYNAEAGIVTYSEPNPNHWTPGRRRFRRYNQEMRVDSMSRPFSAAARVNTSAVEAITRPHSATARLQNSQSRNMRPFASSTSPEAEYADNLTVKREEWMMHRRMRLEQQLATVDLQADLHRSTQEESQETQFTASDEHLEACTGSSNTGGLEAVCGLIEDGKGWEVPLDPGLREYWGTPAGGGAGMERPHDIATVFRDVQTCRGAVNKATFDARWPGSPNACNDRVISQHERYEYRDAHDGAAMFMAKVAQAPIVPNNDDSTKSLTLDIAVAMWLSSINMGHHAHVLASLGTKFADFESLTAGDLFAAGIEQPDEISCILTRLRARVPAVRVVPRPRSARSDEPRGAARPGSAQTIERSFAESQASTEQLDPDPAIVSALVYQGIDAAAACAAAVATASEHSIEAAMTYCLTQKRPLLTRTPVDGVLDVYITGVTGVKPADIKAHDTVRVRCGVQLVADSPTTWSTAVSTSQGIATWPDPQPVKYELRQGTEPVVRLMLVRSRKTRDRTIGAREFEVCRALGPRWTPDVKLRQRFRVHDTAWGDELAIEVTLVYRPDRDKCDVNVWTRHG